MNNGLTFTIAEAPRQDVGRGVARLDPAHFSSLGVEIGDIIVIEGERKTAARVMPSHRKERGEDLIQIDGIIRKNAAAGLGQRVNVTAAEIKRARRVELSGSGPTGAQPQRGIAERLQNLPVTAGDLIRLPRFGSGFQSFDVSRVEPCSPAIICLKTRLEFKNCGGRDGEDRRETAARYTYEDIGGLGKQIRRIREMIELPLKFPDIFDRLGIDPPQGVLLYGPPGTGKTLIARAVAAETDAHFIPINGPEIIQKFYGESEAQLRKTFQEAAQRAPSIIFLDELDAIAPKRTEVRGDVEKRVVAQLLALMDGLNQRGQVIVIGATNVVDSLDPALRRPGRFDREIAIDVPNRNGRAEILSIHTRGMQLEGDVELAELAEMTHGFVGADLEALVREAAMNALRSVIPQMDFTMDDELYSRLLELKVSRRDFLRALPQIQPSALREFFVEVPSVNWEDIGGLEEIKQALLETVEWPLMHGELFRKAAARPPRGVLLHGPPGTGKTLLARACASESSANFIAVKGPALFSKWVGETEKAVRTIFQKAKQAAPCIVFFDEIEAFAARRGGAGQDSGVRERAISQFLNEFDGIEELEGVLVIGATNRRDLIDPALLRPGRFDLQFELTPPDQQARRKIFGVHTRHQPLAEDVQLGELAEKTEGFAGADIEAVCQEAAIQAIRAFIASGEEEQIEDFTISRENFLRAVARREQAIRNVQKECE